MMTEETVIYERLDAESLIDLIQRDDKKQLVSRSKQLLEQSFEGNDEEENRELKKPNQLNRSIVSRLLQLACKIDSVNCARALIEGEAGGVPNLNERDRNGRTALHIAAEKHAANCIELLLENKARTDLRSDGNSVLPLEIALASKRIQSLWNPEETIEDLLIRLSETDLSSIRLLVEKTSDVVEVAYVNAMEGRVISLAALLMVAPEKVTVSIVVVRPPDGIMGSKETTTIYECVITEALSLGQKGASSSKGGGKQICNDSNYSEKRKLLLFEIELLQLFGPTTVTPSPRDCKDRKTTSPLIRASQAGDDAILKLLLKTNVDVNETDAEGNSALHWCLRSISDNNKQARVMALLLKHGAAVRQKNRLGMTPLHVAASKGYVVALQILLLKDPDCVDAVSLMKETPLFLAVKNDFKDCAQLLLRYGANTKILNIRKQRPIDMATSQDMRFLLSPVNSRFGNHNPVTESAFSWLNRNLQLDDSDGELAEALFNQEEETNASCFSDERVVSVGKTEVCKYFKSPGGCVRGSKCHFAHGEEELLGSTSKHRSALSPVCDQDTRKIFVGGLPPSVDSETLEKLFEEKFGAVEEAVVMIGSTQAAEDHQVHSRGFGFVTFKTEESVAAAVQAHYISMWGKRVEIKAAVSKKILLGEMMSPKSTPPSSNSKQQKQISKFAIIENKTTNNVTKLESTSSWVDKLLSGKHGPSSEPPAGKSSSSSVEQNPPSWLSTFRKWLPHFLVVVSKRLKEGEWYPLSSLKGDFRHTYGLELDHTSLGYSKLSEFMRSLPGICRMKVVPVGGRGAATHMVLLPNLQQHNIHKIAETQKQQPSSSSSCPSVLLDEDANDEDTYDGDSSHLVKDPQSTGYGKFGYGGSVGEGSAGQEEKNEQGMNDDTSNVASGFLQFLKQDPIFHDRQWMNKKGDDDDNGDDGRKKQPQHLILEAFSRKKTPFSFFLREFDFGENYRRSREKKACFGCNVKIEESTPKRCFGRIVESAENAPKTRSSSCKIQDKDKMTVPKMLWKNTPCNCLMWCSKCKMWADRQAPQCEQFCLYCDKKVEKCEFQAWVQHHNDAPEPNDVEFPPLRTR